CSDHKMGAIRFSGAPYKIGINPLLKPEITRKRTYKMKKTLIASAIAAATISGTALAQESNLPTVYGNIQYVAYHADVAGGANGLEHADNGSTLGVLHDHEIAPGITGFFKLELDGFNADDKSYGR